MTDDIAPVMKADVLKGYEEAKKKSPEIQKILKKLSDQKGDWDSAQDYAGEIAKCLQFSFAENITIDKLPNGQMYFNIANRVLSPAFSGLWKDVSDICAQIQEEQNEAAGIGIKTQIPEMNADRIAGIVNRISSQPFEDVKWLLGAPVDNFARSVVDEHVQANADFHYRSGMQPKIIRKTDGKCCEWCSAHAGTFDYELSMDREVFRRHENCGCTVEYDPADGSKRRQDVWDKRYIEEVDGAKDYMGQAVSIETGFGRDRYKVHEVDEKLGIYSQTYSPDAQNTIMNLQRVLPELMEKYGKIDSVILIKDIDIPGIAAYDHVNNRLFVNEKLYSQRFVESRIQGDYFAAQTAEETLIHEFSHKRHWDRIKAIKDQKGCDLDTAKEQLESELRSFVKKQLFNDPLYILRTVSENAYNGFENRGQLNEFIADCAVRQANGSLNDIELDQLIKELLG